MLCCYMLIFFKINFFQKVLSGTPTESNSLDPDFVGPDLGPACLQRLSADDSSRKGVKMSINPDKYNNST